MHGTRMPSPRKSTCGGATTSDQPPQSSHTTTMAVDFQYLLFPTALTTDATHDGPVLLPLPGWSELIRSGMTHVTPAKRPALMSPSTLVSGTITFFQSGPY